jgi:hypothetical protein
MVHAIPVEFVTPAEVQVLQVIHATGAQGEVVNNPRQTKDVARSSRDELARLSQKYGYKVVSPLWDKLNPKLPMTFAEIGISFGETAEVSKPTPPDAPDASDGAQAMEADPEVAPKPEPAPDVEPRPVKKSKKTLP